MGSHFSCRRDPDNDQEQQPAPARPRPLQRLKTKFSVRVKHKPPKPKIVHVHNKDLRAGPVPGPPLEMAHRGAGHRLIQPPIIDLVSDEEDDHHASPFNASPSPALPAPFMAQQGNLPPLQLMNPGPAPNPPQPHPHRPIHQELANGVYLPDIMVNQHEADQFQDFDDFDIRDAELERAMFEQYHNELQRRPADPEKNGGPSCQNRENAPSVAAPVSKATSLEQVMAVFPGICQNYVSTLYDTVSPTSDGLIAHILDKMEKGDSYPSAKEVEKSLKRKRTLDEDEAAAKKYGAADRIMPLHVGEIKIFTRTILANEFPETPMVFIDACLAQVGNRLFSAYRVLEEANRTYAEHPAYNKMKSSRKIKEVYREESMAGLFNLFSGRETETELLHELQASRRIRKKADMKREAERQLVLDEEENIRKAEAEGTMQECGCCFGDYPLNRMIHCNSEETLHFFCRGCARQNAETEIGASKYQLRCMSMDGCDAGFSIGQRSLFLDEITIIALERNEQEAVLRMAGIENLASCPFCPYAAEYPPVEIDREFRCEAPDCEKVSCRLCKLVSHIPKSCEEHAKENGLSIRRQIEEAMSAALIRKCNKCQTPFVKEEGCNKMTCTRGGCRNVQCYVCSENAGYDHFNDTSRGGKTGNCPLFESVEQRHENEVNKAEKEALEKVRAEHPEYTDEDLKVKVSDRVKQDEERRKSRDPAARIAAMRAGHAAADVFRAHDPLGMANDVLYQQRLQEARRRLEGAEQRLEDMRRNQAGYPEQMHLGRPAGGHRGDNFPAVLQEGFGALLNAGAAPDEQPNVAPDLAPDQVLAEMIRRGREGGRMIGARPRMEEVAQAQHQARIEERFAEIRAEVEQRRRLVEQQVLQQAAYDIHPHVEVAEVPADPEAQQRDPNRRMMGRFAGLANMHRRNVPAAVPVVPPRLVLNQHELHLLNQIQPIRRQRAEGSGNASA